MSTLYKPGDVFRLFFHIFIWGFVEWNGFSQNYFRAEQNKEQGYLGKYFLLTQWVIMTCFSPPFPNGTIT